MYYYTDILRYLFIYQNIDNNNENDNNMNKKNDDSMNNTTETQSEKINIQKSDNNKKFEIITKY